MRSVCLAFVAALVLLLISLSACTRQPSPTGISGGEPLSETALGDQTSEPPFEDFDPGRFDHPTEIDNEWLPLRPGTRWVLEGTAVDEDGETVARRIEFTVTDLTKEIAGVSTVVAWIVDTTDGEVVEKEIAFFAQDNDGTVWYLGEYPEEYEDGEFVDAPTWIHAIEGSVAGILMPAEPQAGTASYSEGWAPAVEFTDRAQVAELGLQTCVAVDCYDDVLLIEEFNPEEPGAFQLKYYAYGVGEVRVGWKGEDETQEELELVELTQLGPEALAEVRAMALELERHAYEVSQDAYGLTSPAQAPPPSE